VFCNVIHDKSLRAYVEEFEEGGSLPANLHNTSTCQARVDLLESCAFQRETVSMKARVRETEGLLEANTK